MTKKMSIENVEKFSDSVFKLQISLDEIGFILLVGRHKLANGVTCLTGHDILRLLEPEGNFHVMIGDAIAEFESE